MIILNLENGNRKFVFKNHRLDVFPGNGTEIRANFEFNTPGPSKHRTIITDIITKTIFSYSAYVIFLFFVFSESGVLLAVFSC